MRNIKFTKKVFGVLIVIVFLCSLCSCSSSYDTNKISMSSPINTQEQLNYEIAMISDYVGTADQSFNKGAWDGVEEYANSNNKSSHLYTPTGQSSSEYMLAINEAITNQAKIVVTTGIYFDEVVFEAQSKYPEVYFIMIDGKPKNADGVYEIAQNTVCLAFEEHQAGYLAGYATVIDGYEKLGFIGGAIVPAVANYGFGFVQGANAAAEKLSKTIDLRYYYTGSFEATKSTQNTASSWCQNGIEVIFSCGGGIYSSVFSAVEIADNDHMAIGVDIDQSDQSEIVLTSAIKNISKATSLVLNQIYGADFPGGQVLHYGVSEDAVGLPMSSSRFKNFSQDEYDAIFADILSNKINILSKYDSDNFDPTSIDGLNNCRLEYVN